MGDKVKEHNRLVALTGMPGAGKSTVTKIFSNHDFLSVYFGGLVVDELTKQNRLNEKNERELREKLRRDHGMAAFAILSLPKIEEALLLGDVIIDDMYSWEEYVFLKERFPYMETLAVYAPPALRYARLKNRPIRPFDEATVKKREVSQIENLHQAGPIVMANWTFVNIGTEEELASQVEQYINKYN